MAFSTRCLTAAFVAALLSHAACTPAAAAQPAAAEVMQRHGVVVDDLYAFIEPHLAEVQPPKDVHFTAKGYDMLGGQVAEVILGTLERK
jgi:hypothetical protein